MSLITTTTSNLVTQFNALFAKKYRNPPLVILDPLIGLIVKHGNWKYIAQSYTEAFSVAMAWAKRERPKWEPLPKTLLSIFNTAQRN